MVSRTIGRQVFNSPQSFSSLSSCDAHGRRWWLEDHVYIRAAAARAHEAAPQPAEREAEALGAQTSMSAEAETDLRNADVSQRKIVPLAQ